MAIHTFTLSISLNKGHLEHPRNHIEEVQMYVVRDRHAAHCVYFVNAYEVANPRLGWLAQISEAIDFVDDFADLFFVVHYLLYLLMTRKVPFQSSHDRVLHHDLHVGFAHHHGLW